jgi:hypothetical protein
MRYGQFHACPLYRQIEILWYPFDRVTTFFSMKRKTPYSGVSVSDVMPRDSKIVTWIFKKADMIGVH